MHVLKTTNVTFSRAAPPLTLHQYPAKSPRKTGFRSAPFRVRPHRTGQKEHAEVVQGQGAGSPSDSMKRNGEDENAARMQDTGDSGSPVPSDRDQDTIARE